MRSKQRGIALLIIALILGLATVGFFFSRFSARNIEQERAAETTAALAEAKAALLGFAVSFESSNPERAGRYGFLPCPELSFTFGLEGSATGNCGTQYANKIGRLPWRSLQSAPLRDGNKECLWYAVSGSYKNSNNPTDMLNADTTGQFEISGQDGTLLAGASPENRAVAVIFSPGSIVGSQNRTTSTGTSSCPGHYTAADYLEVLNGINNAVVSSNSNQIDRLVAGNRSETFNDRLVFITQAEIFSSIVNRTDFLADIRDLTARIANCLADGATATPANLSLSDYRSEDEYRSVPSLARGRVPNVAACLPASQRTLWQNWKDHFFYARCNSPCTVNGGGAYDGIVFFAGRRLNGQERRAPPLESENTKGQIRNYLEGCNSENFASGTNFQTALGGGGCLALSDPNTFNDTLYCIGSSGSNPRVALCS